MLKVGDTVLWSGCWGNDPEKEAKVEHIEINCKNKSGDRVKSIEWSKVDETVIVDLDNGHYAYGYQIRRK